VSITARVLVAVVRGYRLILSPWLGNSCRFEPTCSAYAIGAIEHHGALTGTVLAAGRLMRCHPWCAGGCDPVPLQRPGFFTVLVAQPKTWAAPRLRGDSSDTTST
jgi:putative membrane protein insertion efficiency factor